MAVPVLPYTAEYYNSLPELQEAKRQFESAQAFEILYMEIGKAFIKHHVENILGAILLHNHFLVGPHEKLVNIEDNIAVPVDTSGTKQLGPVNASAWRFMTNGIAPYEFTRTEQETSLDSQPMQSFLEEFAAILAKWNLTNIVGITSLKGTPVDGSTTMEFTSGRANITLPFDIAPNDGNVVDAMWQFSSRPAGSSLRVGPKGESK